MGGFDGTSNVLAGMLFDLIPKGTLAHSFITSFNLDDREELKQRRIRLGPHLRQAGAEEKEGMSSVPFLQIVDECRTKVGSPHAHEGELLAFAAYSIAYPDNVLVLVDTYDTLSSGLHNFVTVAMALHICGWRAVGVRLDSGDLSYLSKQCRTRFQKLAKELSGDSNGSLNGEGNGSGGNREADRTEFDYLGNLTIVASNDLSEKTLLSLNQQGHEINCFGVGTDLVTCKAQPALGCVYKLVELEGRPRIKLSDELGKVTLPGKKEAFRLFDKAGTPIFDLLTLSGGTEEPKIGYRLLCRHPFEETKRAYVTPSHVQPLLQLVWDHGKIVGGLSSLMEIKANVTKQLQTARPDHLRPLNPTPYKVSVTSELYSFLHNLWLQEAPVREIA
jgi:nicotinate phosphoribosyltransferase